MERSSTETKVLQTKIDTDKGGIQHYAKTLPAGFELGLSE